MQDLHSQPSFLNLWETKDVLTASTYTIPKISDSDIPYADWVAMPISDSAHGLNLEQPLQPK